MSSDTMTERVKVAYDFGRPVEFVGGLCSCCGKPEIGPDGSFPAILAPGEAARIVREAVEEAARKAGHGGDMVVILSQEWEPGGHGAVLIRKTALVAALGVASEEKTG